MNDKILQMIAALGSDGLSAFYFYVIVEALQFILFLSLLTYGVRTIWPYMKKEMFGKD